MPNIEEKLKLAAHITTLRQQLAAAEAEFAGTSAPAPRRREPAGRGPGPSISQRVLNIITEAGPNGITRRDILAVIPHDGAVHSALKVHAAAGRIASDRGAWVFIPATRPTREMRAVQPPDGVLVP